LIIFIQPSIDLWGTALKKDSRSFQKKFDKILLENGNEHLIAFKLIDGGFSIFHSGRCTFVGMI
jgi:hypothetical protein